MGESARLGEIEVVVFDLGGVLVRLGPYTDVVGENPMSADEFWAMWLSSPAVRRFESGASAVDEFGEEIVSELGLPFAAQEFVRRFTEWPKGLFDGAQELVGRVRERLPVAVLSNISVVHWTSQRDNQTITKMFDGQFLSYEMGLVKPDLTAFHHVINELGVEPNAIFFLDDNHANISAARGVGMDAILVKGVDQARHALVNRGVLHL